MNRNVESHFSMLPSAEISRSRFDRSQDVKFTFNVGDLIPFYVDEVLPGDTFDVTTSKVVRMQTLLTPVMDNIYLDTYFFFVPNRLVWKHWRELMGENRESAWLPEAEYSVPQIKLQGSSTSDEKYVEVGDILDYMGIPVGIGTSYTNATKENPDPVASVNALPFRAYQFIFNEWFRDENLTDPVNWSDADSNTTTGKLYDDGDNLPLKAAKYHDYFTSCLPAPQKGPQVICPTSFDSITTIDGVKFNLGWPVLPRGYYEVDEGVTTFKAFANSNVNHIPTMLGDIQTSEPVSSRNFARVRSTTGNPELVGSNTFGADADTKALYFNNLFAYPANNSVSGIGLNINDLRYAFQLQKLYERDARGGTRYIEIIKAHFNVDSPDARMQRPEYLGGNRIPISIHQITNQSQGESDFLGDVGAMSLTTDKHSDFVKSFTEHGFVIGLCVARYDHSYPQGLERMWTRKGRFDYYWPVFANLGEQAVMKSEIYLDPANLDKVFGYQERWAEYRYKPNRVAAEMRPGVTGTLDSWHFADSYDSIPSLSDSWIREDKTNVDRCLAVSSAVSNQLFADIYIKNYTTRPMPLYSIPGLIDHH